MEIKSVDSSLGLVEVTIENPREYRFAQDEYGHLTDDLYLNGEWLSLEERIEREAYPFDQVISLKGLTRVAGRALLNGKQEDVELARKIVDYFELQHQSSVAKI